MPAMEIEMPVLEAVVMEGVLGASTVVTRVGAEVGWIMVGEDEVELKDMGVAVRLSN